MDFRYKADIIVGSFDLTRLGVYFSFFIVDIYSTWLCDKCTTVIVEDRDRIIFWLRKVTMTIMLLFEDCTQ